MHHVIYTAKEPWDEPKENLRTLCCDCHYDVHDKEYIKEQAFNIDHICKQSAYDVLFVLKGIIEKTERCQKNTKQKLG